MGFLILPIFFSIGIPPANADSFNYSLSNSGTVNVTKSSYTVHGFNTVTASLYLYSGPSKVIRFSVVGTPPGVSGSSNPAFCVPGCSTTIQFDVSPTASVGTFPIQVMGEPMDGGIIRVTIFNLVISDSPSSFRYGLSNSGPIYVTKSPSYAVTGSNTITATLITGSPQPIYFSLSGIPSGVSLNESAGCGSGPSCSVTLRASVQPTATAGIYPITVSSGTTATTFNLVISNPNQSPTANAGIDLEVHIFSSYVSPIGASESDDGYVRSREWTQISGPTVSTIANRNSLTPTFSNLMYVGTYVFRLTVTDNTGLTGSDEMSVVTKDFDQSPRGSLSVSPTSCVIASGASTCSTVYAIWTTIGATNFKLVDGNTGTVLSTSPTYPWGLQVWVAYPSTVFYLNSGDTILDTKTATATCAAGSAWNGNKCVTNQAPSGSLSIAPTSCVIASGASTCSTVYATWSTANTTDPKLVDGNTGTTLSTSANQSSPGLQVWVAYPQTVFNLKNGGSMLDTKTATATCAAGSSWDGSSCVSANSAPIANAGADRAITLPTNSVIVSGASASDSDGTISARLWTRTSGPSVPTITDSTTLTPTFSGLIAGTYVFRLTVTDNGGLTGLDEMSVVVSPIPTTLSIVVSPSVYSVTLPNNTISAIYTLTNGTSANTNCRLLDNTGAPLTEYAPCTGSMSVSAPITASGGTYGYSIRANKSSTGETVASNSFTVTVNPSDSVLYAILDTIDSGQSTTLMWNFSGAASCEFVGTPANGISTSGATSGSVSTGVLTETQNYQIICTDADGNTFAPALVTVIVLQPSATISANPSRVQSGTDSTISWSSHNMDSCSISGPGLTASTSLSGSQAVTILSQSTYTITCQAIGFPSVTQSVIVNILPLFQEF
ncbi:hypothetical protein A2609_01610 [Candidatus Kaiserbacteria bacterium RIFOXYD1_FULL_47_14]|uniref:PKD/Chitinase domain-containing protein n=1 Tax=Candidatus Kaiserbacteria bacterium RIFOXYD1_FULL_47_14 TaxID=1798533 RepID=A0A1F6G5I4_9BACT|nr:MAG: hypothetical protein A2609_01610 [Candidatus Kaiserbacteria bacterium RIFOXYD1_FULL_47_14]